MAGFNVKAILGIAPLQQSSPRVPQMTTARRSEKTLRDEASKGDRDGALALGAAYTAVTQNRKAYFRQFEDFKNFYIVDAILSGMVDDALSPEITTGEILEISSKNPDINRKLKDLKTRVNFDSLIMEICPDLVGNGEYSLKTTVLPGKGVVAVSDTVEQESIVALYDHGVPSSFLVAVGNDIAVRKASEYAHFYVGHFRVRIPIEKLYGEKLRNRVRELNVPPYARFGKPLFYGTLSKVKELQLLENLIPSAKLSEITRGSIIGVSLPSALDPATAFEMCRQYEQVFNSATGVNRATQDLSISDIIAVAGKVKALPMFGEKGSLQSLSDIRSNKSVDDLLNSVNDIRAIVCTSIGYPPELLFAGNEKKGELLKRYSRYLRKLKSIQTAIANGIKQICLMHLVNLEMPSNGDTPSEAIKKRIREYSLSDIDVSFRNKLVNVDELEKLEFADAMVSTAKQTFEFIMSLLENESFKNSINLEAVQQWLSRTLMLISPTDELIIINKPQETNGPSHEIR